MMTTDTTTAELFYRFGVALAIGFLIGLQREFSYQAKPKESFAGVRTFTLLGLAGCAAALVSDTADSPALMVAVFAVIGALVVASYIVTAKNGDVGATTEVAAIVTLLSGALCYWGMVQLAGAVGVATALILSAKIELKRFVARLTREDIFAVLKFGVVTAIVLPVLPDRGLGPPPFDVLNPYKIWLMVVLISGLGFVGYLLIHMVGPSKGIGITGFLGGLVSSTALTLSFSQRSRSQDRLARPFALAIMVAWAMMFARVLVAVAVVNRGLLPALLLPLAVAGGAALAYGLWLQFSQPKTSQEQVDFANPFELGPSLRFGLVYAGVLLFSRAAQLQFGDRGVYLSALVSGLADVDAITLSLADLSRSEEALSLSTAAQGVVLAAMANTAAKGAIVLATAGPSLKRAIAPGLALILVGGLAAVLL
jgi:uncharacterized membrane protein (DUF4010 family)